MTNRLNAYYAADAIGSMGQAPASSQPQENTPWN